MKNFKLLRGDGSRSLTQSPPRFIPPATQYEPMRQNRFVVTFPESLNIPSYFIRNTSRPSLSFNNQNGLRHEWDDIEFVLFDAIGDSSSQRIFELINSPQIENPMVVKLEMLDPTGVVVSDWSIWGRISSIDFGSVDYTSDDLMEIKITMSVSNAILNF